MKLKKFVAYYHFISFAHFSLGVHIDLSSPNFEIHLPFGFVRVGWFNPYPRYKARTFTLL